MSKKQTGSATGLIIGTIVALVVTIILANVVIWVFFKESIIAENGEEVVLIDRPYFWGPEGVRHETLKPGTRSVEWKTTVGIPVNVLPQRIELRFEDLPTVDNYLLDFTTSIQVRVTNARDLIQNKGADWFVNNLQAPWQSAFRDLAKSYTMAQLMADAKVAADIESALLRLLNDKAKADGLPVVITDFNMGRGRPNPKVIEQLDQTAAEQQRSLTLIAAKNAEVERKNSENARAQADKEYGTQMGYTTEQNLQIAAIKAYSEACKVQGSTCVIMAPGAMPNISVK